MNSLFRNLPKTGSEAVEIKEEGESLMSLEEDFNHIFEEFVEVSNEADALIRHFEQVTEIDTFLSEHEVSTPSDKRAISNSIAALKLVSPGLESIGLEEGPTGYRKVSGTERVVMKIVNFLKTMMKRLVRMVTSMWRVAMLKKAEFRVIRTNIEGSPSDKVSVPGLPAYCVGSGKNNVDVVEYDIVQASARLEDSLERLVKSSLVGSLSAVLSGAIFTQLDLAPLESEGDSSIFAGLKFTTDGTILKSVIIPDGSGNMDLMRSEALTVLDLLENKFYPTLKSKELLSNLHLLQKEINAYRVTEGQYSPEEFKRATAFIKSVFGVYLGTTYGAYSKYLAAISIFNSTAAK